MRNRVVREGFWNDEELGAMPRDARLLFVGLWAYADDWGRLEERPMKIRAAVFPYDRDIEVNQITAWIDLLVTTDKLLRYEVGGQKYLFIRKFFTYQQMRRHKASTLPPPPGDDGQLRPPSFISGAEPTLADDDGDPRTSADIVRNVGTIPRNVSEDKDKDIDKEEGSRAGATAPVLRTASQQDQLDRIDPDLLETYRAELKHEPRKADIEALIRVTGWQPKPTPQTLTAALRVPRIRDTVNPIAYAVGKDGRGLLRDLTAKQSRQETSMTPTPNPYFDETPAERAERLELTREQNLNRPVVSHGR